MHFILARSIGNTYGFLQNSFNLAYCGAVIISDQSIKTHSSKLQAGKINPHCDYQILFCGPSRKYRSAAVKSAIATK